MQRFSNDLWREMNAAYGRHAVLSKPVSGGFWMVLLWLVWLLPTAVVCRLRGGRMHLADASLFPYGALCSAILGIRVSVTVHGKDLIYPLRMYQVLIHHTLSHVFMIHCVSGATATEVLLRGADSHRVVIIPCGIQQPEHIYQDMPTTPMLLTVGRLVPRKGVLWFIEYVLPRVVQHKPEVQYVVAGAGPDASAIATVAEKAGVAAHVRYEGLVSDERREELYRAATLFIQPNIPVQGDMEGFGIVCIEASSRGVPVVASKLEGLQDAVIEGETGMFFRVIDPDDAVHVVLSALQHPLDRQRVAAQTAKHFQWDSLFRRYQTELLEC